MFSNSVLSFMFSFQLDISNCIDTFTFLLRINWLLQYTFCADFCDYCVQHGRFHICKQAPFILNVRNLSVSLNQCDNLPVASVDDEPEAPCLVVLQDKCIQQNEIDIFSYSHFSSLYRISRIGGVAGARGYFLHWRKQIFCVVKFENFQKIKKSMKN